MRANIICFSNFFIFRTSILDFPVNIENNLWKDNEPVDDEEYWDNSDSELNKDYSLFKLKCKNCKQNYLNSYSSQLLYAYISIYL